MLVLALVLLCAAPVLAQDFVPLGQVIEAESLTEIVGAQPEDTYAEGASGGAYVYLPDKQMEDGPPNSYVVVPLAALNGACTLRVRAYAASGGSDSLRYGWGMGWPSIGLKSDPPQWQWYEMAIRAVLPGPTRLIVGAREPARIDAIEVVAVDSPVSPHQAEPLMPEPNGERPLDVNPPTFRWYRTGPQTACRVQVASDEALTAVVVDEQTTDTFLRPVQPLAPGRYWWRMRAAAWDETLWSAPQQFEVTDDLARWPLPDWRESFARVPAAHPRLWLAPGQLEKMREWAQGDGAEVIATWRQRCDSQIGRDLPLEEDKERQDGLDAEAKVIQRTASKVDASRTGGWVQHFATMYLLTGDEKYADEVRRRALLIADLDPQGYTSHSVSDFANGTLTEALAYAYDYCPGVFTEEERAKLREALLARLEPVARSYRPNLEQRVNNAHAWQHCFLQFAAGCLALYGEDERATDWFQWATRSFVALYPWFGGADGGSAECDSYFEGTNLNSSMDARDLFFAATGIDLCDNPWYRNNIYFTIYGHPPNHLRSQFGDHPGGPMSGGPSASVFAATRYRAALMSDPFAAAYASATSNDLWTTRGVRQAWQWIAPALPEPRSLSDLPAARVFADIGTVFMHSNIADPDRNIFIEFKCSPYGSHGHNHADQNCFNVSAFDEPLLIDSGYYHSYGDPHHNGWTRQAKAHNGILVDGTGQPIGDLTRYGRLIGFEQGDEYVYCAGEAGWAYSEVKLDRFTRHLLWLRPDLLLVYDQIETPEPHAYQFLLHAERQMTVNERAAAVDAVGEKGQCRTVLLHSGPLRFTQEHEFDPPARRWRDDRNFDMPDQWHLAASTVERSASQRFLAVVEIAQRGEPFAASVEPIGGEGWLGCRVVREGEEVVAGFARELPPLTGPRPAVDMQFGSVSAHGFAAAAEVVNGQARRLVTIGGDRAAAGG